MTTPVTQAILPVTQEDREAAWPHRPDCHRHMDQQETRQNWDAGIYDHIPVIQAFARHRSSSTASSVERVCSACDGESKGCTGEYRCLRCEGTGVEPDFVDGLDNRPKADDAAVARAARAAHGEWLAWPDAARDGPVPVDNERTISWLSGVPSSLANTPAASSVGAGARKAFTAFSDRFGNQFVGQSAIRINGTSEFRALRAALAASSHSASAWDETLSKYVQHLPACRLKMRMGDKCDCGLDDVRRAKQAAKPTGSALPVDAPSALSGDAA